MSTKVPGIERETINLELAGKILGISRPVMYDLARRDQLPVPIIKIGRRMVVSKYALDALLNATKPTDDAA